MTEKKIRVEKQIGRHTLSFETGQLAKQAAGAVMVQYGETVVLVASASDNPRPGLDFFPLTCDYRERLAAAGKFPGGFLKREGRPTTKEILSSRLMDRPIRPLWPAGYKDEVQVQAVVVASDLQNDGDVLAMNGASASLHISELPFQGPIASVRVGKVDGKLVAFPIGRRLGTKRTGHDRQRITRSSRDDRRLCQRDARRRDDGSDQVRPRRDPRSAGLDGRIVQEGQPDQERMGRSGR